MARPMPLPAPVTNAAAPSRSNGGRSVIRRRYLPPGSGAHGARGTADEQRELADPPDVAEAREPARGRELGIFSGEHDETHALAVEHSVGPVGEREVGRDAGVDAVVLELVGDTGTDPGGAGTARRSDLDDAAPSGSSSRTLAVRPRTQRDPGTSGLPARAASTVLTTETTTSATATAPSATRPTRGSGAGHVRHHHTTDHEMASHVSIPRAHVQITRYGKISPTMRDTDTKPATIARPTTTSSRNAPLARLQVMAAAPTRSSAATATGVGPLRSRAPL